MTGQFPIHPRMELPMELSHAIFSAAATLVADAFKAATRPPRKRQGETLRPGLGSPLWNALVAQLKPLLKDHGEKARLARVLGVPRQTVNMWVTSRTRMPDAERTLQLIAWSMAKRAAVSTSPGRVEA
jgi:hypothetical protein